METLGNLLYRLDLNRTCAGDHTVLLATHCRSTWESREVGSRMSASYFCSLVDHPRAD